MKKVALTLVVILITLSCNSTKNTYTSSKTEATELLNSLDSDSTIEQVYSLFRLLDNNSDKGISSTESIGIIAENFSVLDTDRNASINFKEFKSLFTLLNEVY